MVIRVIFSIILSSLICQAQNNAAQDVPSASNSIDYKGTAQNLDAMPLMVDADKMNQPDNRCFNETVPAKFFNTFLDNTNPSSFCPPRTDAGSQDPFKYPFSFANRAIYNGGWARQVTVRSLPVATAMAGVQMRLNRGAIRELHWHLASEWAYVIYGTCRVTLVEPNGRAFVGDVGEGGLWLFPSGAPHSIQGVGDDGCFFLLVFNDGNFNEFGTILLTDYMSHIPKEVLSKNFQVPPSVFNNIPPTPLYIFPSQLPRPLDVEIREVGQVTGYVPQSITFDTYRMKPNITRRGGMVKVIDATNFPITPIAAAVITLKPGAIRELHWHPNAPEWQYHLTGKTRVGVFNGAGEARTMDCFPGDVVYIDRVLPHYIENTCEEDAVILEIFPAPYFYDVALSQWWAHLPPLLLNQHIRTGEPFIRSINKTEAVLQPW